MKVDEITVPVRITTAVGKEFMDSWQERVYLLLSDFVGQKEDQSGVYLNIDQAGAYVLMKMIDTTFIMDKSPKAEMAGA